MRRTLEPESAVSTRPTSAGTMPSQALPVATLPSLPNPTNCNTPRTLDSMQKLTPASKLENVQPVDFWENPLSVVGQTVSVSLQRSVVDVNAPDEEYPQAVTDPIKKPDLQTNSAPRVPSSLWLTGIQEREKKEKVL